MAYIGRTPTNAALTAADLADGIVSTAKIAADAVTDAKIADDVVGTEHLTANEVDTAALKADAVTGAELADNAINSEHYTDGSIDTAHIAADQITNAKIADDQIDSEHYVDGSIDTAHIANVNVTQGKIADQAINEAKMQVSNAPTNGYMLSAQSGNTGGMTWAAAPSGGLNVITSSDISSGTSLLNNDGNFSSTYDSYYVVMSKVKVSASTSLFLRLNQSGSALTGSYSYASLGWDAGGDERRANNDNDGAIYFASNAMIGGNATHNLSFYITDPLNAIGSYWKVAYGHYGGWSDQAVNSALISSWSGGYFGNTTAMSGFQIGTSNSATFDTGNITLYGVKTT